MLKDLSNLEKELAQLIADKKQQLSLDCVLPDAFKRLTRRIENNIIVYQQYSFTVSSTIDIYFPNQLWYFAAICVPLYTELKKYADLVKRNLTKKEIIDCKDNRTYAETLINSKSELIVEKDNVINFLSDYKWWRGGKTIDRGDYYYSPILSICNLVNASQGYVAEMCKYLSTNPEATQILLNVVDNLPEFIDDYEIIVESSKVVEFLCLTVKELLMFDENMSMIDFNINTKTIGVSGCNIGKLKDVQDKNDDPRRANDCDTSVVWEHNGKKYYFLKEQTADGGKAFIKAINEIYKPYYKAEFDNNMFILKKRKVQQLNIGLSNNQSKSQKCINGLPLQQIFFGAPGTGKSCGIKRTLDNNHVAENNIFRTTFHPDSDYSTFVGAYKPTMEVVPRYESSTGTQVEERRIAYNFIPQAFLNAYVRAYQTDENVYLVIEEINRGNCAQIFGDLFQLLDRGDDGKSEYSIKADTDIRTYLEGVLGDDNEGIKGGNLCLPANLYILATMNTSDQSLFPIDSAFKRRWEWEYVPIRNEGKGWVIAADGKEWDWWQFLEAVNEKIASVTDSEDKKLGYYFVKPADGHTITAKTFVGKVLFYLWNDVFKDYGFSDDEFQTKEGKEIRYPMFYETAVAGQEVNEGLIAQFLNKLLPKPEETDEATNTTTQEEA
jgi:ATPase associated with various cellular activities AAA_5